MMENDPRLPASVGTILTDESAELHISPVYFWEISIKRFDRLLIAQAQHTHLTILTRDEQFAAYEVSTIWNT